MKNQMFKKKFVLSTLGLAFLVGCDQTASDSPTSSPSTASPKVTASDVKKDAATSMKTTAAYSKQEKDKLLADMKAQMVLMDAKIEKLRIQGKDLASDAKSKWDLKMVALEEKRKSANERLTEFGDSTSKAWSDVEKGAKSAWDELSKAFQDASNEF